jgi:transglutaminase-like putative cysteine protease
MSTHDLHRMNAGAAGPRRRTARASLALTCAFCVAFAGASGVSANAPSRWEPVPPEQLAPDSSRVEPGADAEALFFRTWITDTYRADFYQEVEHYNRIKLFTAAGTQKYGKIDIDVPVEGASIRDIQARTIQPDGTILTLDKKAVVSETIAKLRGIKLRRFSFAPPGLKPGCILEYRWREARTDFQFSLELPFQTEIPAREITYYTRPLSLDAPGWYVRQMEFHLGSVLTGKDGDYEMNRVLYQRAYQKEPFSPPPLQQSPWILQYYTNEALTSPEIYWPHLGRTEWEWFEDYTKPDKEAKSLAKQIAAGATNDAERLGRVARWIQRDFRVVRSSDPDSLRAAGLKPVKSTRDALRQRGGSSFDADLAFATLLRALGVDTRFLRVPSRRLFFFDRNMMAKGFIRSYQIAARLEGRWRTFDPADPYLPWDMVPWDEEGMDALLCDRDSSRFIVTSFTEPERSMKLRTGSFTLAEDGTVEGDLSTEYSGHLNREYRVAFDGVAASERSSTLIEQEGWSTAGMDVSNVELLNGSDLHDPLRIRCHLRLPGHGTATAKRIIFEPALLASRAGAFFTAGTRRHPVYFPYPWTERDSIRIRLPEGWRIESGEPPRRLDAPGVAAYQVKNSASTDAREVIHERSLRMGEGGTILFPVSAYAPVKQFFDLIHDHDKAAVTLVRSDQP